MMHSLDYVCHVYINIVLCSFFSVCVSVRPSAFVLFLFSFHVHLLILSYVNVEDLLVPANTFLTFINCYFPL